MGEILSLETLLERLKKERPRKRIVFTNGCFDLLHVGHVRYLKKAKALGDILIVGVNNDQSVKKIKKSQRPIIPEKERKELVAALESVDFVVDLAEDTPIELISKIKPDIHVKGGDYRSEDLPEGATVRSYGGEVVILPLEEGYSSTQIIERILQKFKKYSSRESFLSL